MKLRTLIEAKIAGTTVLGRGGLRRLKAEKRAWVALVAVVGIAAAALAVGFLVFTNFRLIASIGAEIGRAEIVFLPAVVMVWVLGFFVAFPVMLSTLYFSRDARLLLALPIRPTQIVAANAAIGYFVLLGLEAVVMLTAFIAYAPYAGSAFLAQAVLTALVVPLLPLAVSILAAALLTRLVDVSRFRVGLEAAGMLLLTVGLVAIQGFFSRAAAGDTEALALVEGIAGFAAQFESRFPPVAWLARAMAATGWSAGLVVSGALGAAAASVAVIVVGRDYTRAVIAASESRKARPRSVGKAPMAQRPVWRALLAREIAILRSNSAFLFETAGEVAIFPILLAIFAFATPGELMTMIRDVVVAGGPIGVLAAFGALVLMGSLNTVAASGISREGRLVALSRALPLSGADHMRGKLALHIVLFYSSFVVNSAILVAIMRLDAWVVVIFAVAGYAFV
ncbi:MAG: hypothetical protein EA426_18930, partial [Spirochaetaceae bacterium]